MSQSDEDVSEKKCHINFTMLATGEPRALIQESADTRTSLERALAAVNDIKMGFVPERFFFAPLESAIVAKAEAEGPFPNRSKWGTRTEIDWGDGESDKAL
jgi:hypothetical protein